MRRLGFCIASLLLFVPACDAGDSDSEGTSATSSSGGSTGADPGSGSAAPGTTTGSETTGPGATTFQTSSGEGSSDTGGDVTTSSTTTDSGPPTVIMETSAGTLRIELFADQSPVTVDNFLAYVAAGFYDGSDGGGATIFHRVIPGFVIQGGGLTEALEGKDTMPPIVNEHDDSGLTNDRGTLSMARLPEPDTATSQFFINLADNPSLDISPGYAVFARVTEGMDIVDTIAGVQTGTVGPFEDVPTETISITSVSLE